MTEDKLRADNSPSQQVVDDKPDSGKQSGVVAYHEQFAGPLPHPSILAQYEKVVPGAAERIIKMAENQSAHRRDLESIVIRNDVTNSRLGMIFGFVLGLIGLSLPAFVKTNSATWVSIASLASLVGVFITGTYKRNQERKNRRTEASEEKEE